MDMCELSFITSNMKDWLNINTSNSTSCLQRLTHWLNEPIFIITIENILHAFIARAVFEVYNPQNQRNSETNFGTARGWGSINRSLY